MEGEPRVTRGGAASAIGHNSENQTREEKVANLYHSKKDRVFVRGIQGAYNVQEELDRLRSVPRVRKAKDIGFIDGPQCFSRHYVEPKDGITQTFHMHLEEYAPGASSQKHGHVNEAAFYILDGNGYEIHDGVRYDWSAGDIAIVQVRGYQVEGKITVDDGVTHFRQLSNHHGAHLEVKVIDPSANVYVAGALLLGTVRMAIATPLDLPEEITVDPGTLPAHELARRGVRPLGANHGVTLDAFAASSLAAEILGEGLLGPLVAVRRHEVALFDELGPEAIVERLRFVWSA